MIELNHIAGSDCCKATVSVIKDTNCNFPTRTTPGFLVAVIFAIIVKKDAFY